MECFTEITKMCAGRLRPDFLEVCQPDVDWHSGVATLGSPVNAHCTTSNVDGRKSFCSGHASTSAMIIGYNMINLIWAGNACSNCQCSSSGKNKLFAMFYHHCVSLYPLSFLLLGHHNASPARYAFSPVGLVCSRYIISGMHARLLPWDWCVYTSHAYTL